jgi:branched-chain amino acid transport system substrate-binding protein
MAASLAPGREILSDLPFFWYYKKVMGKLTSPESKVLWGLGAPSGEARLGNEEKEQNEVAQAFSLGRDSLWKAVLHFQRRGITGAMTGLRILYLLCLCLALMAGPAAAEVRLGLYFPMTGPAAAMGQMAWEGAQVAHQLKPQILGQPVKLILADTRSDRIEAANAVSRLIEKDKVAAIMGEIISSDTLAGAPIAERARIPMVTPTATNPLVTQGRKFIFRAAYVDDLQGKVAARFAWENLKARKVALLIDQAQDYCVGLANFFMAYFKARGGEIVAVTYIQTGDQDFSAQLSAIKSKNPDLIYAPNYYAEDALLARQLKDLGIKTPVLTGDGAQVPELIHLGGPAVEGMYFTGLFHRQGAISPLARKFTEAYEARFKKTLDAFTALGGEAYFLLADAMERAGTTDGPKVAEALAKTRDFEGVTGRTTMGPDHNPIKGVTIIQVEKGQFKYITTINP